MSTVRDLHDQAMILAQDSVLARDKGEIEKARELALGALDKEATAAGKIAISRQNEPTRSILFKSAASLALQAGELELAERLVANALLGFPTQSTRTELASIYEQVRFEARLQTESLVLSGGEITLSIKGAAVGYGQVLYKDFKKRIDALISLLDRTSRRQQAQPYQRGGRPPGHLHVFQPILGAPKAGSFSVTVELASRKYSNQSILTDQSRVIGEVISGIQYVQSDAFDELEQMIGDEPYFLHFVTTVRELAPDGENVDIVSIESQKATVDFTRIKSDLLLPQVLAFAKEPSLTELPSVRNDEVVGILVAADARKSGKIGLQTETGYLELTVPEGLDDLVRTYFNFTVSAQIATTGNELQLLSVQEIEEQVMET